MNRVCCGAVNSSWTFPHGSGGSHGDNQSTKSVRFVTENIMFRKVRQDDFEKFMTVKHKKSYYLAQIEVYLTFLLKRCPFYAAASVTA